MELSRTGIASMPITLLTGALIIVAMACSQSGGGSAERHPLRLPADTAWPITLEGVVDAAVEEGTPYEDGLSEINFCSLEVSDGYYLVEIPGLVVRAAGLTRDEFVSSPRLRVTISGPSDVLLGEEVNYYRVTHLESLD